MAEIPVMNTNRNQILFAVFVIVAFCIVTIGVLSYRGFKKEFRKDVENNPNAISNLKVAEIVQWREEQIGDASVFMENQNFSDLVSRLIASPANPELLNRLGKWLKQARSAHAYECISLPDIGSNELLSEPFREKWWIMLTIVALSILSIAYLLYSIWHRQKTRNFQDKFEIERDRAWLQNVISRSLNEIYVFDPVSLKFIFVNDGACLNLGYSMEELSKLTPSDIKPEIDNEKFNQIIEPLKTGKNSRLVFETILRRKNGSDYPVEVHLQLVNTGNQDVFLEIINDITLRRIAEEKVIRFSAELEQKVIERTTQLEAANKELEAFAYSVSHDLRAPLRAIDGFSRFVLEDYEDKLDTEGKRMLNLIRSNTQKMDQLITDLLSLSRVTRSELNFSGIDMTQMAVSMFKETAAQDVIDKMSFTVDQLPEAFADPTYIRQVWVNLIANAIKFSSKEKKPLIKICGRNENGLNVYNVKDNGVGFNPEYGHKLFGVFQRLHKSDDFEGTGVGLAIVQRIIHRHGGKVWAEGEEGKGATFYFSLPVKRSGL